MLPKIKRPSGKNIPAAFGSKRCRYILEKQKPGLRQHERTDAAQKKGTDLFLVLPKINLSPFFYFTRTSIKSRYEVADSPVLSESFMTASEATGGGG